MRRCRYCGDHAAPGKLTCFAHRDLPKLDLYCKSNIVPAIKVYAKGEA